MTATPPQTCRTTVTIQNRLGLHARPAMALVDTVNRYRAAVKIRKQEQVVDGKSIMQVMMLAATQGTELELEATGRDAAELIDEVTELVNRKFDEE